MARESGCAMYRAITKPTDDGISLEAMRPGDEFRIYDKLIEDAYPATYRFLEWVLNKQVCLAQNLDTKEEFYVFGRPVDRDYPELEDRRPIVMIESRTLQRTKKAEE